MNQSPQTDPLLQIYQYRRKVRSKDRLRCIGRGGLLTDEPGGRADIRITPPVNRLSLFRRLARADFARALIAAADSPTASMRMFDVFNAPGSPPTDKELAERLEQLSKSL